MQTTTAAHDPALDPAPATTAEGSFLDQDYPGTLREGLDQFRATNPDLIEADTSTEVGRLTMAHDCCHVLFGLTTELPDEVLADTWTLAGSTVTIRKYAEYLKHDEFAQLPKLIGYRKVIVESIRSLPRVFKVIRRPRRMTSKWPMFDYAEHLDTPVAELRRRHNIEILAHD